MGKSNNLHHEPKKIYQREKKINNFFGENEIQVLEDITNYFIKKIIIDFSNFLKNKIELVSYNINIEFYNENNIKNFSCLNLLETSPENNKFFVIFSSRFLSVMIDLLFGGHSHYIDKIRNIEDITSSEFSLNKKIITFITERFSYTYEKFFSRKIKFINTQVFTDLKAFNYNLNELLVITSFNFKVNNTKMFFSILSSLSTIKQLNRKTAISTNTKKDKNVESNILSTISFSDMYDIKLDIIARIINISISYNEFYNLSIGSILLMEKPDKIIAFIGNKSVFYGNYKRFNEQSIIFIDEFINKNLESNQDKENHLMNHIEKRSDNKSLINSDKKISKDENISYESENNLDNKNILLDTVLNVTVELGKAKIKIKDFLGFSKGSMLILDKLIKEPLDVFINGHLIASGEIVFLDDKYGLRIIDIKNNFKKIINV
ncbi:flagellar motor switch protein FliN [Buchnera aphidicola]|uniref:Flagellar motor switch protein FliN n=1 Tax=Buchnera aphidicola str. USDA (Myzus persicae) TaxID=1009856 RepID=W0P4B0_BUCMP|nr:flagellar motor switch protein FliN [Buchnera aphidicola]AHG60287.1 Flim [Buchnera aphidicola str. USDA (Myzus persicae)]AHG60865.1 Flim [Buchnera aphidicola str. W106 (Myzus persicae)]AHG61437.1 Flim [Buchnera aphidicola str. G002 (Myzus persicae)]AHG62010.1 Flim [Buchnera aphidicola str. F009 (Myzus persicae)]WAI03027.1 MAG: flagellar motor switch protein FliN [Buchnera aphidicola (Myzus persicae)]